MDDVSVFPPGPAGRIQARADRLPQPRQWYYPNGCKRESDLNGIPSQIKKPQIRIRGHQEDIETV
jgi:hypothetical protein